MVVVDSSVWVEFFRGRDTELIVELRRLLDEGEVALGAPVRLELLSGASRKDWARLRRLFSALPVLFPSETTWSKLEGWIERGMRSGERFGVADLMIAGIADDWGANLWSLDSDFLRMQRLGFAQLHDSER
ncbi:MAG TPA: PIN domain-containing protein [Polyangiaceae bacterium]